MHVVNIIYNLCLMNFTLIAKKQIVMIRVEKKHKYYLLTATWNRVSVKQALYSSTLTFIVKIEFQGFYLGNLSSVTHLSCVSLVK